MGEPQMDYVKFEYEPPDGELNPWMFAMIGVGCAFVIFVIASIYLMCTSPRETPPQPLMRRSSQVTKTLRNTLAERDRL